MLESRQHNNCDIVVVQVFVEKTQARLGLLFDQSQHHGELACQSW